MIVLVAEDDKEAMEDISLVFRLCQPNCILETTNSGKKCLEMMGSKCPDIVILGKNLPDCDSFDLLKQIRLYSQVPVIFLSDARDEPEIVKALGLGADEYITKPIRQLEFMAYVRALLRKSKTTLISEKGD